MRTTALFVFETEKRGEHTIRFLDRNQTSIQNSKPVPHDY